MWALRLPEVGSSAFESRLRHTGYIKQLVEGCKRALELPQFDDALRDGASNARDSREVVRGRTIDVDAAGRIDVIGNQIEPPVIGVAPEPAVPRLRAGGKTLAEELRWQLADEIVRGTLEPGTALDETELARRFRVSRTPVREALRQLAASGLIDARAHRGAVVARPSLERLTGMFEAMAELEALCAGLAAERMTPV